MTDLPAPLTPADCDLQNFPKLMIDIPRLFGSSFNASASRNPLAWMIGHKLWYRSWHQVPAASLPDDDDQLCHLAELGFDLKSFRKAKALAMRGWIKCSDGRLYHPVVAEEANAAWRKKQEQAWRTECARIRKHNQRHPECEPIDQPDMDAWIAGGCLPTSLGTAPRVPEDNPPPSSGTREPVPRDTPGLSHGTKADVPSETASNRQGEGQGQGDSKLGASPPVARRATERAPRPWSEAFQAAWGALPDAMRRRAKSRDKVWPQWAKVADRIGENRLLGALRRYLDEDPDVERTGGPGLQTWLSDGRWEHWLPPEPAALGDEDWRARLELLETAGRWGDAWGPRPGEPDCLVPAHLLRPPTPELRVIGGGRA
jgi:hypothetical protein